MENKILVIYAGVAGIRSEDIESFVKKLSTRISPETFQGEIIVIPIQSIDTKIECINPKYVTEPKLIKEHTKMMENLQEQLQYQLELLKNKKDE
jgi:hypothetical protein